MEETGTFGQGGEGEGMPRLRRSFGQLEAKRKGNPGTEVAGDLGGTISAVIRLAASENSRELLQYA